ncbi:hypothetical protein MED297_10051 [Reinekea sp. MED297]|uniref:EF-hand domain-containing protein n=2 Tax=Reinekea TaxID=230494 RepID=A4BA88_9GAMM|nr:hypothetical protein MED297_10051 [Reinekea sp. MED297] [Reinekea blandensis MED297]
MLATPLWLMSCEGGSSGGDSTDDDGGDTGSTQSARISGSVTLSSEVAGANKPSLLIQKSAASQLQYKVTADGQVDVLNKPMLSSTDTSATLMAVGDKLASAYIYLYDAEHPEWLAPVAMDLTNSSGEYELDAYGCTDQVSVSECASSAASNDNAYVDGDPLPFGIYTMLVYKPSTFDPVAGVTTDPIVAVLPAFRAETEEYEVEEAEAEVSDAAPSVMTMFGQSKNTDGTQTWGSSSVMVAGNSALQITFDMAMSRGTMSNISVSNGSEVSGKWSMSPDWKTATFTPTAALSAGAYTVTVPSNVVNVYGIPIDSGATGTFTAEPADTTAPTVSISSPSTTTNVSATSPIRLTSNEVLKTNSLRVDSTPSIGDYPSVTLVSSGSGQYIYEVVMTEALTLGAQYSMTFSNVQDGAGNAAANLSTTFSVESAASAEGVDDTATSATQAAQVAISEIFSKWVRAVNERNTATITSLMSGSFVFEYSVQAEDGFMDHDINRNGRLSFNEFMNMIQEGMNHWEYCDTTFGGQIIGNVNTVSTEAGNFEFELTLTTTNQSQECSENNNESMYATVKKINGLWKLTRMSEGFDHRGTSLVSYDLIEAKLYENDDASADGLSLVANRDQLENYADNATPLTFKFDHIQGNKSYIFLLVNERNPDELGFAFAIGANRLACGDDTDCTATAGDELDLSVPDPFGNEGMPKGAYPISDLFDFDDERDWGIGNPGESFLWEVIGIGTYTALELYNGDVSVVELVRDIKSVSAVKRFKNPGDLVNLDIDVQAISSLGGDGQLGGGDDAMSPLTYDIYKNGYDAGSDSHAYISVTSPDPEGDIVALSGGEEPFFYINSPIGFKDVPTSITDNGDNTATLEGAFELFQGWNWVEVGNGVNRWEQFQIYTTGGRAPDITVDTVEAFDSTTGSIGLLTLDQWNFADASSDSLSVSEGAVTLDVTWNIVSGDGVGNTFDVDDVLDRLTDRSNGGADACDLQARSLNGWVNLEIYVHNESGAFDSVRYCDGISPTGDITISGGLISLAADLQVFEGDNWINLRLSGDNGGSSSYESQASFGVYTDAGSTYVAPISIATLSTTEGDLDAIGDWGQGSDWDASDVTASTNTVDLVIDFANAPSAPMYHLGADGIGSEPVDMTSPDLFTSATRAEFSITLYNGYNWLNIEDGDGNWYNINIYTENGAELPRPKFSTVNGVTVESSDDFGQLSATVGSCQVTVAGTAPENTKRLMVNWDGGDLSNNYWEGQEILLPASGGLQNWSATFQVISGDSAYNNINVFDETNNSGAWMTVVTTASGCTYTEPQLNVSGVRLPNDTELNLGFSGVAYGVGFDGAPVESATSVIVYGTTTVPGRNIKADSQLCGSSVAYSTQASTTETAAGSGEYSWSLEVELYDEDGIVGNVDDTTIFAFEQTLFLQDGFNQAEVRVLSDNGQAMPAPAISVTRPVSLTLGSEDCGYAMWDGTAQGVSLTSITLTGSVANVSNDVGSVFFGDSWQDFAIDANGDFSVEVPLYDGFNYLGFNVEQAGHFDVTIETANGIVPPQYVFINSYTAGGITNPLSTTTEGVSGTVSIGGDFDDGDGNTTNFVPDWLYGMVQVCDIVSNCTEHKYDSELSEVSEFGDRPMAYDAGAGTFSLDVDISDANDTVYVDVYGCGADGCHGHSFTFNDLGDDSDEQYYKPGQETQPVTMRSRTRHMPTAP